MRRGKLAHHDFETSVSSSSRGSSDSNMSTMSTPGTEPNVQSSYGQPGADEAARYAQLGPKLVAEIGKVLVGQETMVTRLLTGLLAQGHILLEGMPGLAKTLMIRCLAGAVDTGFSRIQFTPDML